MRSVTCSIDAVTGVVLRFVPTRAFFLAPALIMSTTTILLNLDAPTSPAHTSTACRAAPEQAQPLSPR